MISWEVARNSLWPWREIASVFQLFRIYRRVRPDIVHHVAIKPIVYGTLAALAGSVRHVVNAPVGMGFTFTSVGGAACFLKPWVTLLLRLFLAPQRARVVFENVDDLGQAVAQGLVPASSACLIRGAGVDLKRFTPRPEPPGTVRIALIARMLKEKGVEEFVAAARALRADGIQAQCLLVGAPDPQNRGTLTEAELQRWHNEGSVVWLGNRRDIVQVLATTHIVVLPSYREGLPKALLEAMAAGKPIITTDVPGCRDLCENEVNGLLVPAKNANALAKAMRELIQYPLKRLAFGQKGRRIVERHFSTQLVQEQTLALYQGFFPDRTAAEPSFNQRSTIESSGETPLG